MTQIATVEKTLPGGMAEISVARQSACAHDCHECAGCGATAAPVRAQAHNPIGAAAGQKVVVESSSGRIFGVVLLVYLLPVALFFIAYFASAAFLNETMQALVAILVFFCGILPAIAYDRRMKKTGALTFTIVRLF